MSQSDYHQNPKNLDGVPDLCQLTYLQEANVLHNLKHRYKNGKIYTSTTAKVLIAVNPYEYVPERDNDANMKKYQEAPINLEGLMTEGGLEPHTFTVANCAYHNMIKNNANQSVIVCGESGSGKTVSAKLLMKFLAYTSTVTSTDPESLKEATKVGKQVLDANPILETFGNAKTVLNNNSSRFGKFTKMLFQERKGAKPSDDRQLIGAMIETYLLEKSRVTRQDAGERNYHIFYQLCSRAATHPEWNLGSGNPQDFNYLNQSGCTTLDGSNATDKKEFDDLISAFDTLKIPKKEQTEALGLTAGILHLGNVEFKSLDNAAEGSAVVDSAPLEKAAECFGIEASKLAQRLTTRSITVANSRMIKPLNKNDAVDNRDSIAKALYNSLFLWMVRRINKESNPGEKNTSFIGTLDVFGFEIFEQNSLEQFCINFANERLQSFFNYHVLKAEQDLYRREALLWTPVDLPCNQDVISLIMDKPNGIFAVLDSACLQPKGNAEVFVHNVFQVNKNNKRIQKLNLSPRKKRRSSKTQRQPDRINGFTIKHYAGEVTYDAKQFLIKNNDTQHPDTVSLFASSTYKIQSCVLMGETPKANGNTRASFKFLSTTSVFGGQLQNLMNYLTKTTPYFVRCIKPNQEQRPRNFVSEYVLPQLRCGGLVEALRIIKCGFPTRCSYQRMIDQFGSIMKDFPTMTNLNQRDFTEAMINVFADKTTGMDKSKYQLGLTMIFFRPGSQEFFQKILALKASDITGVQRIKIHKFLIRKRIVRMRGTVRAYLRTKHFIVLRKWQKVATTMNIIGKTFGRLLRKVRRRLNRRYAEEEEKKLLQDAKYQEALAAVGKLQVMQQSKAALEREVAAEAQNAAAARAEVEATKTQMNNLRSKLSDLNDTVAELERDLGDSSREKMHVERELQQTSSTLEATAEKLQQQEAMAEQMSQDAKRLQSEFEQTRDELNAACDKANATAAQLEAEVSELKTQVSQLKIKQAKTSEESQELEHELNERLSKEKSCAQQREQELEASLRDSRAEASLTMSRLTMLQAEYEAVQCRLIELERTSSTTIAQLSDHKKQLEGDLEAVRQRSETELQELQDKYTQQRKDKSETDIELMQASSKVSQLEEEVFRQKNQLQQEHDSRVNQLRAKDDELATLGQAKAKLTNALEMMTNKHQSSELVAKQAVSVLKSKIDALERTLQDKEEESNDTIRKLKKEIRDVREGSLEDLAAQLSSANGQLSAAKASAAKEYALLQEAHAREVNKKNSAAASLQEELDEIMGQMEQARSTMNLRDDANRSAQSQLSQQLEDAEEQLLKSQHQQKAAEAHSAQLQADLAKLQSELESQKDADQEQRYTSQTQLAALQNQLELAGEEAAEVQRAANDRVRSLEDEVELQIEMQNKQEERYERELKTSKAKHLEEMEELQEAFENEKAKLARTANGATAAEVEEWTMRQAILEGDLKSSRATNLDLETELQDTQRKLQAAKRQLANKENLLNEAERRVVRNAEEHSDNLNRISKRHEAMVSQLTTEAASANQAVASDLEATQQALREMKSKEMLSRNHATQLSSSVDALKKQLATAAIRNKAAVEQAEDRQRSKVKLVEMKHERALRAVQAKLEAAAAEMAEVEEGHVQELAAMRQFHRVELEEAVEGAAPVDQWNESNEALEQMREERDLASENEAANYQQLQALSFELVGSKSELRKMIEEFQSYKAKAEMEKQQLESHNKMVALAFDVDNRASLVNAENKINKLMAENSMLRRRNARNGNGVATPMKGSPQSQRTSARNSPNVSSPLSHYKLHVPNISMFRKDDGSLEDSRLNDSRFSTNSLTQAASPHKGKESSKGSPSLNLTNKENAHVGVN